MQTIHLMDMLVSQVTDAQEAWVQHCSPAILEFDILEFVATVPQHALFLFDEVCHSPPFVSILSCCTIACRHPPASRNVLI